MPEGLTIGIDGRDLFADHLTGLGRLVLTFLEDVSADPRGHRYVVFLTQHNSLQLSAPGSSISVVTIPEESRLWWDQVKLPKAMSEAGVDVFFSPYPKVPLRAEAATVNLVADVIPLTWPAYSTGWSAGRSRAAYRLWCNKARRTITLSEHAKGSIVRALGLPPERIVVIPGRLPRRLFEAPSEARVRAVREAYDLPERFCLYVGSSAPHKNVASLVEGYSSLPEALRKAYPLILAGFGGGEAERFLRGLSPEARSTIRSLGALSDEPLHTLYHEATLFVFPSLAEGFGFPPLEAMACSTPVIAVSKDPMPEVLGDAPYWVEMGSPQELASAIQTLLESESRRRSLIEAGLRQAEMYATSEPTDRLIRCLEESFSETR